MKYQFSAYSEEKFGNVVQFHPLSEYGKGQAFCSFLQCSP